MAVQRQTEAGSYGVMAKLVTVMVKPSRSKSRYGDVKFATVRELYSAPESCVGVALVGDAAAWRSLLLCGLVSFWQC